MRAAAAAETIPFATTTDSTAFGDNRRRRRRRPKVSRPPAVDSTLLRFVSEQRATPTPTNPRPLNSAVVIKGESSWWAQFNSHRIASLLLEKDPQLDASAAQRAGEAVQSQALARQARRQIRSFLKERDEVLLNGKHNDDAANGDYNNITTHRVNRDALATPPAPPPPQTPMHTFEESVDVMLELGLTIKDVADILHHTPGVALMRPRGENGQGETLETTLTRVLALLGQTLRLRRYNARKVIRTCPGLLTVRRSQAAAQVVIIMSRLGVSAKALSRDLPALSHFLLRPPAAIFRLVSFLASDAIRMPVKQIGPLLRRRECRELLDCVAPIPSREVLLATNDGGADAEGVDDLADTVDPTVASALWGRESIQRRERIEETYRRMSKTAWTLRHEIGTKDLGKVIAAYPSVLLLDAEETILPNAHYLMNDLGIWEDDLPKVLQLYPTLLGTELDRMKRVTEYLLSLDVPEENLPSIFRSFPRLLTLDIEQDMEPVVEFLQAAGIRNLGRFICRLPPILGYSVSREILPKWNYLAGVCADPRFEVTKFPAFFSYPLERVRTRYDYLRRVKRVPTQFLSVDQIMSLGDKDFATKVVGDLDEGRTFLYYCEQRKKALHAAGKKRRPQPTTTTRQQQPTIAAPTTSNTSSEVSIESSRR